MLEPDSAGLSAAESEMDVFLRSLRSSGLINESRLQNLVNRFQESSVAKEPSAVSVFAFVLVEKGELTCWQCAKLRNGQVKGFFCDEFKLLDCLGYDQERSYYLADVMAGGGRVMLAFRPGATKDYVVIQPTFG